MNLLQDCSLLAVEAAREYATKDIEISHAGNVFIVLVLGEGKCTLSLELNRLALPPDGSALSLVAIFGGVLLSIVLNIL